MQQGGINLVINTERKSLANSSYLVHGTSAYTFLALRLPVRRIRLPVPWL